MSPEAHCVQIKSFKIEDYNDKTFKCNLILKIPLTSTVFSVNCPECCEHMQVYLALTTFARLFSVKW